MQSLHIRRLFLFSMALFLISSVITLISSTQLHYVATMLQSSTPGQRQHTSTGDGSEDVQLSPTNTPPSPTPTIPQSLSSSVSFAVTATDTFERADQVYWGSMNNNIDWDGEGANNPAFSIQNKQGIIMGDGNLHHTYNDITSAYNVETLMIGQVENFQNSSFGIIHRWTEPGTWYTATLDGEQFILEKSLQGQRTPLLAIPFKAQAQTSYSLRFRSMENFMAAKAWPTASPEPENWQIITTDTTIQKGYSGLYAITPPDTRAIFTKYIVSLVFY